jgi:hypothetical protein
MAIQRQGNTSPRKTVQDNQTLNGPRPMSLLHNRTHSEYGLVLALICMALALVVAKYLRQQSSVEFPSAVASGVEEGK